MGSDGLGKPGGKDMKKVTIRDVARHAQVALGTVSRVLNDHSTVEPTIRAKVLATIKELGYRPNAVARSMRGAGKSVGIVVSSNTAPLFAQMVGEAEKILWAAGYTVTFASTDGDIDKDVAILDVLRSYRAAGLITAPSSEEDPTIRAALADFGAPVVLWERTIANYDCIVSDQGGGLRQAMNFLLRQGHKKICLLTVPPSVNAGRARLNAYMTALSEAGLSVDPRLVVNRGYTAEYGFQEICALFADPRQAPTALIAGSTHMMGVLRATRMLGIRVPEQLSLIALGDADYVSLVSPAMTVVRWDAALLGRVSAEALIRRINGTGTAAALTPVIPQELVVRDSCASPSQ